MGLGPGGWAIGATATGPTSSRIVVGLSSTTGEVGSGFFRRRNSDGGSSDGPLGVSSSAMRAVSQTTASATRWMSAVTVRRALVTTSAPSRTLAAKTA